MEPGRYLHQDDQLESAGDHRLSVAYRRRHAFRLHEEEQDALRDKQILDHHRRRALVDDLGKIVAKIRPLYELIVTVK